VRLLLDSHFVLAILEPKSVAGEEWATESIFVSVASLWEIAIKVRQGKLHLVVPPTKLAERLNGFGCEVLPVTGSQAVAEVDPWPDTNDPFDRLLLAVCQAEDMRLVTRDRRLVDHPLAWKPAAG
jgi:PIN domain nuclease of toxin-antitoxin system